MMQQRSGMRTLGEAFRSTFTQHEEWPRTALAGLGDQVTLDTPVTAIESGALWLMEEGENSALPTLLILTRDRLVVGQTATGRGGLRWLTLSSVDRMDSIDDETTGDRVRIEMFLKGGLGLGVKCSDPFVESLVESLRNTAHGEVAPEHFIEADDSQSRQRHPTNGRSNPPMFDLGTSAAPHEAADDRAFGDAAANGPATNGPAMLSDAISEVDNDASRLDDLHDAPLREGPVPILGRSDGDAQVDPAESVADVDEQLLLEAAVETDVASGVDAVPEVDAEAAPEAIAEPPIAEPPIAEPAIAQPPAWTPPSDWAPPAVPDTAPAMPMGPASTPSLATPPPAPAEASSDAADDVPILPTRNKGRAYNVGLEAERNLTAEASGSAGVVPPAPTPEPIKPAPLTPAPMFGDTAEQAEATTEAAPPAQAMPSTPPPPPSGLPSWHSPSTSFTKAFDESDTTEQPVATPAHPNEHAAIGSMFADESAPAPATEAIPVVDTATATEATPVIALGPPTEAIPALDADPVTDSTPVIEPATEATPMVEVPAASDDLAETPVPHDGSWVLASDQTSTPGATTGVTDAVSIADGPTSALPVIDDAPVAQVPTSGLIAGTPAADAAADAIADAATEGATDTATDAWTSWPTDAPHLATPAGYGDEEYDPSVDDFSDLAAGSTSFDNPNEDQPQPQPAMVGVSKANHGWWQSMPMWPDAFRSMTYLGGHPEMPKKRKNITMFFRPEGIRTEAGGFGSWKIELPWEEIIGMNVESSDELMFHTNMRIDLSSAALAIQTEAGTLYFECRLRRPATVRSALAPILNAMGGNVG